MAKSKKDCGPYCNLAEGLDELKKQTITISANQKVMMKTLDAMTSVLVKQGQHDDQIKRCEESKTEIWTHIDGIKTDISTIKVMIAKNTTKTNNLMTAFFRGPGLVLTGITALGALGTFIYNLK